MNLSDSWKTYQDYTADLSKIARPLGFAGAGIAWLFRTAEGRFTDPILVSLAFTVAFFAADLLQYYTAALVVRYWTRAQEKKLWASNQTIEGDVHRPAWLDTPAFILFHIKIITLFLAFVAIGVEFWHRWR